MGAYIYIIKYLILRRSGTIGTTKRFGYNL